MEIIRSFSLFDCFCFVSRVFCSFCICVYEDSRAKNVGKTQFFFLVRGSTVYSNETFHAPLPARKKFRLFYIIGATILTLNRYKKNQKGERTKQTQ